MESDQCPSHFCVRCSDPESFTGNHKEVVSKLSDDDSLGNGANPLRVHPTFPPTSSFA